MVEKQDLQFQTIVALKHVYIICQILMSREQVIKEYTDAIL